MTAKTPGGEWLPAHEVRGPIGSDPATAHRAALTVCRYAVDAAEARELLAMLGLVP